MTTNRGFSLRFDRMRENDPTGQNDENPTAEKHVDEALYAVPGGIRNVCFAWADGKWLFLNYAYLVSGAFASDGETNTITLSFTSHIVALKGYALEGLYNSLMEQLPRMIEAQDARYRQAGEGGPLVADIIVSSPDK